MEKLIQSTKSSKEGFCGTKVSEKLLVQGAEALILKKGNNVIKNRIKKSYRISELDEKIRKSRTRSEKKLLEKACKIINAPNHFPLKEWNIIKMPFIQGKKLSEHLDIFSLEKQKEICKQIGESTAKLHDNDIIHGDLTTSNMILVEDKNNLPAHLHSQINQLNKYNKQLNSSTSLTTNKSLRTCERTNLSEHFSASDDNFQIFFIDFGLGFISKKTEDKAVDLHLLRQALEAKHFKNWEELFNSVIEGYKSLKPEESKKILERLKAVEKRGRYKH